MIHPLEGLFSSSGQELVKTRISQIERQIVGLKSDAENLGLLKTAVDFLRRSWAWSHKRGDKCTWFFFVRDCRTSSVGSTGLPRVAACTPFWAEEFVDDLEEAARLRPGVPLPPVSEALHYLCPTCGYGVPVIGSFAWYPVVRDHRDRAELALYTLCPHAPAIRPIASSCGHHDFKLY